MREGHSNGEARRHVNIMLWARLVLIGLLAATAAATIVYALRHNPTETATRSPWGNAYFPNVPVVTHDGQRLRFYDDLIKGKIVVINFIYTSCADICSLTTARLAQVRELLGNKVGREVFMYSITLDPVFDGPEVLKKYARNFYDGPGWLFLTGTQEDIEQIRYKLGERSRSLAEHRSDVVLGNDRTKEWSRDSAFTDVKKLAATIEDMDPVWREQVRHRNGVPAETVYEIRDKTGQALFMKACSACHTIGRGVLVGPDLADVGARRDATWLKKFIIAPDEMLAAKDPDALALAQEFNGLTMPNLGLSESDAEDVLTYIGAETGRVRENLSAPSRLSGAPDGD